MARKHRKLSTAKWTLIGYDTFSNEEYSLTSHKTQALAETAAAERMQELERTQPSSQSGGQGMFGIQDRVYIERPDGTRYQWFTTSGTLAALTGVAKKTLNEHPEITNGVNAQINGAIDALDKVAKRARNLTKQIKRRIKAKGKK